MRQSAFFLLLLLSAAAGGSTAKAQSSPGQVVPAPFPVPATSGDVSISAGLSEVMVKAEEPVKFWLTIRNRSSVAIENVALDPSGLSHYTIISRCWRPASGASCVPSATAASNSPGTAAVTTADTIVQKIEAGQTLSVWGELSTTERHDAETLYVTVEWTGNQKQSQVIVPLGQITARDWPDSLQHFLAWFLGLLKDLALPILLAYLAYRFKKWEDEREGNRQKDEWNRQADRQDAAKKLDEAKQQAQKDLDLARQDAEKKLDQQRQEQEHERMQLLQTWNMMLPVSHRGATRYYMPMASAANGALERLRRCTEKLEAKQGSIYADGDECRHALYYFLLLRRRARRIGDEIGGFYFKDRIGERLAGACWNKFAGLYLKDRRTARESLSRVLTDLDPNEKLGTFLKKLNGEQPDGSTLERAKNPYQIVLAEFHEWLAKQECKECVPLLQAFLALLRFEMNKPYSYWYPIQQGEKLQWDNDIKKTIEDMAKEIAQAEKRSDFETAVQAYIAASTQ
jgi:hypothetical protein